VCAPVGCEPRAREFYGGLLGLSELEKPEGLRSRGGVWFAVGAAQLHVGVQEPFVPARKAHPGLAVSASGIEALARRLAAVGAPVDWDHAVAGVRRLFTEDPWGNRLELVAVGGGSAGSDH
jgi:catechol 2,3-dioxygenase-like lactoylglutathione lyase family enzyme